MRTSGGHVKVRDYFDHCLAHPELDPYVYFTPRSSRETAEVWRDLSPERIADEFDRGSCDLLFVADRDWKLVPKTFDGARVINLLQSLEACQPEHRMFRYLKRPALRICVSEEVFEASAPYRAGEAVVIKNGIPLDLFTPKAKRARSIVIWGLKDPGRATALADELRARDTDVALLLDYVPREEYARLLQEADLFVGFTKPVEGFYLPALEAMACGCAVVCRDATGNRGFCIDGETCLMPAGDDVPAYLAAVETLLGDGPFAERLRRGGLAIAQQYSLEQEREAFYHLLDTLVLR